MVGQHDPPSTDSDRLRASSNVSDDNRRRGARDASHAVVFSKPETFEAPSLSMLCKIKRVAECPGRIGALGDGGKVEYRYWNHESAGE